ncbi:MAG TPA: Asp23/Gls24 family envelope stress response protein [Candidatus Onthovivens sp.]|nr:Asp23/Gls24 family envelope stress response protein [Candidatus Onthovivens sp.]
MEKVKKVKNEVANKATPKKPIINVKELSTMVGEICSEAYGVVGLTKVNSIRNNYVILLKKDYIEGVVITSYGLNEFVIDVHLILAYGVKITEVASEVSKRISYFLSKKYGKIFKAINVYVEGLQEI